MKIVNPPDCSVTPAVVVHTLKPQTPSLQAVDVTVIENKSTLEQGLLNRALTLDPY
jgi:hypothetical protein